jgi:hypothetical protein
MFIHLETPMILFSEKRTDKNGHIFYLCYAACVERLSEEADIPEEKQNSIYSNFYCMTIFDKKIYAYTLITHEKIMDFSYEEKKKIIESVRIEEIK